MARKSKSNAMAMVTSRMGHVPMQSILAIPDCRGEECRMYAMCAFKKTGPCAFRKVSIERTITFYLRNLPEDDERIMRQAGLMLIPAWDRYFQSLILSQSITNQVILTKAGLQAHPIFALQDRFLNQIAKLESKLNMPHAQPGGEGDDSEYVSPEDESKLIDGDPDYYDLMSSGIEGIKHETTDEASQEDLHEAPSDTLSEGDNGENEFDPEDI